MTLREVPFEPERFDEGWAASVLRAAITQGLAADLLDSLFSGQGGPPEYDQFLREVMSTVRMAGSASPKVAAMDTERKVGQLDSDIHEIYGLLDDLKRAGHEQRGMIQRQGNRLDSLEANVAQLAEDAAELKADMAEVKGSVGEILELLRNG